tara:strand:- start:13 stop:228 length:216 start_codon:yes stop_codon:yes gene_type:complete
MKRKFDKIKVDMLGNFMILIMFANIPPISLSGLPLVIVRDSGGRLSGNLVIANEREINERRLENIHGNRYG